MLFNSIQFLIFFPLVTIFYFVLPHRWRWLMLLTASCAFYMYFIPIYILVLAALIVIDYIAGICIEGAKGERRKLLLVISLISNVGALGFFKYYNFFALNMGELAHFLHWNYSPAILEIILPIGLSFHTFQSLSYVIEVYQGRQRAERSFGIYALYVMFYPQLVAGPIERPQNMLHQFYEQHTFDYEEAVEGLTQMLWGMFKKVVIADNLALMVNYVYNAPTHHHGLPVILATVFFAFQIYCDFSGYSDIAIGAARVMGFRLMTNFNRPYFSRSIVEFWKRWHISLSTWFRDYLLFSLRGNQVRWTFYRNVFLTFIVSGLWHGANWTFIIWGALHGLFVVASAASSNYRKRFNRLVGLPPRLAGALGALVTFGLVCFAWIFFRANSVRDALLLISSLPVNLLGDLAFIASSSDKRAELLYLGQNYVTFLMVVGALTIMLGVEFLQGRRSISEFVRKRPLALRWATYTLLVLAVINLGVPMEIPFIYFQF